MRFSDDDESVTRPNGFTVRTLDTPEDADLINRVYVRCGMVPAPVDVIWDNHVYREPVDYLVAVRDDDSTVVGTVTGVDTRGCSPTPRTAPACGRWPSIRLAAFPASAPR